VGRRPIQFRPDQEVLSKHSQSPATSAGLTADRTNARLPRASWWRAFALERVFYARAWYRSRTCDGQINIWCSTSELTTFNAAFVRTHARNATRRPPENRTERGTP